MKNKTLSLKKISLLIAFPLIAIFSFSCGIDAVSGSSDENNLTFTLMSKAYSQGAKIPLINACSSKGGNDKSPQYSWENAPEDTEKFAIIMDDENSPCGTGTSACRHWAIFGISAKDSSGNTIGSIAESYVKNSAETEGKNYMGVTTYAGPCPPAEHTYKTTIYALKSNMPSISEGVEMTRAGFESSYSSYILDKATIEGVFTP
jgi:Raf kinase inhibitor-like YbhB/YbcL family protein